ncbi:MAG: UvrD-helicase domain-containing protein [Amylibacter sp.]|nr:UvrD-helicase domain-containing protein [Amylibacter sp.]
MSERDETDAFERAENRSLSQMAMGARGAPYLDGLNPEQRQAVETLEGPVLMLAGAGTGKTKALTTRIVHLLNTGHVRPNQILAVTFTNKAAREMKLRVGSLLGEAVEGMPWLGTFHSLCVKILRRHAELVGLKSNFTILDTDDQLRLLKQLIRADNIDDKKWPARQLAGIIDNWKNRAWTPDKVPVGEAAAYNNKGVDFYKLYQMRLRTLNATDFGDLLLHVVTIFQTHPDILRKYQSWFRYILVDEYQDTNVAQYLWLRLLASEHKNICCVGDDDQSIYGWRGAEVGNILRFEKDFPGAHVVRLEQNYRSTHHILGAASAVISGNKNRLGKTLWTDKKEGDQVRLIGHWDGEEEARWIGEEIENFQRGTRGHDPMSLDDMAILVRASHQMRAFEDRFLTIGLPYRVIGGPRFYERMEIRDAMAYFRVAISHEDGLAFERIVNTPKRGIGDKAVQLINQTAREHDVSLLEGARILVEAGGLAAKARGALKQLVEGVDRWSAAIQAGTQSHIEIAEIILDESGYTGYWKNDKTPEGPGRLENLKELVKALEGFENLQGFLEHISLIMENEQEENTPKVTIMTLHAAKGLEFPAVFLPGWEDGLFPSQRSMDETGQKGVEEERRLAYVGITRAEEVCTISFATNRRVYGQWQSSMPSRFIDELPIEHVEVLTPPGLHSPTAMSSDMADKAARADAYSSPGWKRMQARNAQYTPSTEPKPKRLIIDAEEIPDFAIGNRVAHEKYGAGTVIGVEAGKLSIVFDGGGAKKILASFVTMQDEVPF